jgi:hypothetical protein
MVREETATPQHLRLCPLSLVAVVVGHPAVASFRALPVGQVVGSIIPATGTAGLPARDTQAAMATTLASQAAHSLEVVAAVQAVQAATPQHPHRVMVAQVFPRPSPDRARPVLVEVAQCATPTQAVRQEPPRLVAVVVDQTATEPQEPLILEEGAVLPAMARAATVVPASSFCPFPNHARQLSLAA